MSLEGELNAECKEGNQSVTSLLRQMLWLRRPKYDSDATSCPDVTSGPHPALCPFVSDAPGSQVSPFTRHLMAAGLDDCKRVWGRFVDEAYLWLCLSQTSTFNRSLPGDAGRGESCCLCPACGLSRGPLLWEAGSWMRWTPGPIQQGLASFPSTVEFPRAKRSPAASGFHSAGTSCPGFIQSSWPNKLHLTHTPPHFSIHKSPHQGVKEDPGLSVAQTNSIHSHKGPALLMPRTGLNPHSPSRSKGRVLAAPWQGRGGGG